MRVDDGKLRIICFGAHPDDAEYKSGGNRCVVGKNRGITSKLVSVTNGDIGHWQMSGGELAKRRTAESAEVARRLGVTSQVLDIHDGELLPHAGEPPHDHPSHSRMEGGHRDRAPSVGLSS